MTALPPSESPGIRHNALLLVSVLEAVVLCVSYSVARSLPLALGIAGTAALLTGVTQTCILIIRRRNLGALQWSLRLQMLAVAWLFLHFGPFVGAYRSAQHQRQVLIEFRQSGRLFVAYGSELSFDEAGLIRPYATAPRWIAPAVLIGSLGKDFFEPVHWISFETNDPEDLRLIQLLPSLRGLRLRLYSDPTERVDCRQLLRKMRRLEHLDLSFTFAGDDLPEAIGLLPQLREVKLDFSPIDDEVAFALASHAQIRKVSAFCTNITEVGFRALLDADASRSVIWHPSPSAAHLQACRCIEQSQGLTYAHATEEERAGGTPLKSPAPGTFLNISLMNPSAEELTAIEQLEMRLQVVLHDQPSLEACRVLSRCHWLERLVLTHGAATASAVAKLANPNVLSIDLSPLTMADAHIHALKQYGQIQSLTISDTRAIFNETSTLADIATLERVEFQDCIPLARWNALLNGSVSLRTLELRSLLRLPISLEAIGNVPLLEALTIDSANESLPLTDIAKLPHLRTLTISRRPFQYELVRLKRTNPPLAVIHNAK